jgi:uncharacterized protein YehS (DUF1456 family)
MINNDVLRNICNIFELNREKIVDIIALADHKVTQDQVHNWLRPEDDPDYQECSDVQFAIFLNGLIDDKRGKKEGSPHEPEQVLNNNIIFRKLKIALDLKAEEVLDLLASANLHISKHELSAFFRRPGNRHYRDFDDQGLSDFLKGLELKYRPIVEE